MNTLGVNGRLEAWERPWWLRIEDFLTLPHDKIREILGDPVSVADNMFVNNWFIDVFTVMGGGVANIQVGVLCLGTGSMTGLPTRLDSTMVTEWNRYVPVSSSVGSTDPTTTTLSFFSPASDGTASITEAGLWHGGATTAAGSGRMTSHFGWVYAKSTTSDVRIDYTITRGLT